jgi:hypothetical protein
MAFSVLGKEESSAYSSYSQQLNARRVLLGRVCVALPPIQLKRIAVTLSIFQTSVRITLTNLSRSGGTAYACGRGVGGCYIVAGLIVLVFRGILPRVPVHGGRAKEQLVVH